MADSKANAPGSTQQEVDAAKTPSRTKTTAKKSGLPAWISSNLRNKRSLQVWCRCWIASWASFILMIPNRSLLTLGQAAFFTAIISLMLPPMLTPFLWLLAISTLVIGALMGWAIGCAAMASALRARNVIVTGAAIQRAQQSAASATNPELAFRNTIFEGQYLDTHLSVFTYILGYITTKAQKLKLFCIFATIVLDVHVSYGPLFPSANYTLATIFMVPIGYYLAIAAACIILIFPRSLNADWTDELGALVHNTVDLLRVHQAYLHKAVTGLDLDDEDQTPSDEKQDLQLSFAELSAEFEPQFRALSGALITGSESLIGSGPFLELEPSRGIFSGKDLRQILSLVKAAGTRVFGMNAFHHLLENKDPNTVSGEADDNEQSVPNKSEITEKDEQALEAAEAHVSHSVLHVHTSLRFMHWKAHRQVAEAQQHVRFREDLLPVLHKGAMPALTSAESVMQALEDWLKSTNEGRWSLTAKGRSAKGQGQVGKLNDFRNAIEAFEAALNHFIDNERIALLKPYEGHFVTEDRGDGLHYLSQETYQAFRHSARPVFLCLLFCANFANFGTTSLTQLRAILALSERRLFGLSEEKQAQLVQEHGGKLDYAQLQPAGPKIWFPTGLRKLGKIILSKRGGAAGVGPGSKTAFLSEDADEASDEGLGAVRRRPLGDDPERGTSSRTDVNYRLHTLDDGVAQRRAELEELALSEDDDEEDDDSASSGGFSTGRPDQQFIGAVQTTQENGGTADVPKQVAKKKDSRKSSRTKRVYAPDPDALPPTNALQRFIRGLASAYDTACSPDGVFALRYAIVSFALWIPAVIPSSAGFYYRNRGLWALIMGQTGLTTTTGEAVFQIVGRVGGTVVGALGGMVVWYISAGSGRGNAIGLGAVMGVVLIPLTFLRAFVPITLLIPTMLSSVTLVLIVGYSWIDTHLPGISVNSGWGKEIAWRRLLCVLIGVAAAIIVMLVPRPITTRVQVRKGLASSTRDIHRLYCLLIEGWIISDVPNPDSDHAFPDTERKTQERIDAKLALFRARFQLAQAKLAALVPKIKLSAIDLQMRGKWDAKSYDALLRTQARQLEALAQLAGALHSISPRWRHQFALNTAVLDPDIVADITLQLSLIAASLENGEPLPHAGIGVLLERVLPAGIFNSRIQDSLSAQASRTRSSADQGHVDGKVGDTAPAKGGADQPEFLAQILSFETLQKRDYMNVVLGAMALTTLARRTDELANITATLCGELQLRGFDQIRDEQGRRQLRAFGIEAI
ncbi:hypothetical protein V8E36_003303 [Tilletia maclaganii]